MTDESAIDTRISPEWHPSTAHHLATVHDLDSEAVSGQLDVAGSVLDGVRIGLGKLHDLKAALAGDSTLTKHAAALKLDDAAEAASKRMLDAMETAHHRLVKMEQHAEATLTSAIAVPPSRQAIAGEIRKHVADLPADKRLGFIADLIKTDPDSAAAILSAPAFLSGLSADLHDSLRRELHATTNPRIAQQGTAAREASALLRRMTAALHGELSALAILKPGELRGARAAAARTSAASKALA